MDGANFVVQFALDPFWYPDGQQTPRRLFAVAWATAPARLVGFLLPSQIRITSLLFGAATYSELALPLIVTINSKLDGVTKSTIVILFVSATCFLANIPVSELVLRSVLRQFLWFMRLIQRKILKGTTDSLLAYCSWRATRSSLFQILYSLLEPAFPRGTNGARGKRTTR